MPVWVVWRWGAIPWTAGRGPGLHGSEDEARKPSRGRRVGGRRGGARGLRRAKGRRRQMWR